MLFLGHFSYLKAWAGGRSISRNSNEVTKYLTRYTERRQIRTKVLSSNNYIFILDKHDAVS